MRGRLNELVEWSCGNILCNGIPSSGDIILHGVKTSHFQRRLQWWVVPGTVDFPGQPISDLLGYSMVKAVQNFEHGWCKDPGFGPIEQYRLDYGLVEHS